MQPECPDKGAQSCLPLRARVLQFLSSTSSSYFTPPPFGSFAFYTRSFIAVFGAAMSLTRDDTGKIAHLHEASGLLALARDCRDASGGAGPTNPYVTHLACSSLYVQILHLFLHRWRNKDPTVIHPPGRVSPVQPFSCARTGRNNRGCNRSS